MTRQFELKSENSFRNSFLTSIIGGIILLIISIYLIQISLNDIYPQLIGIITGLILGIIGLLSIFNINKFNTLTINNKAINRISIWGYRKKTIFFIDILYWTEIEKSNKYYTWTELTLYTKNSKYKLYSNLYNNYSELKKRITKGHQRNIEIEDKMTRLNFSFAKIFILISGIILTSLGFFSFMNKETKINKKNTIQITDVIVNQPKIKKFKSGKKINIFLKSQPTFIFEIYGNSYEATKINQLKKNVYKGDSIKIDISLDDYETKITKIKNLSFWDKTINYRIIPIYGIHKSKNSFLTLSDYNKNISRDNNDFFSWLFCISGLFILIFGIKILSTKPSS